jgi:hypothetical protein
MARVCASMLNECADGRPIPSRFPRMEASISPCVFAACLLRWSRHRRWNKIIQLRRQWVPLSITGVHSRQMPRESAPERRLLPPGRPEAATQLLSSPLPSPRPEGQGQTPRADGATTAQGAAAFGMYLANACEVTTQPADRTRDHAFHDRFSFPCSLARHAPARA